MKWTCKETQKTQDEFRVTIHDGSGEFRLQLQGNLGPAESREVESCWRTAASTIGGRRFIVDLSLVQSLHTPAAELLSRIRDSGAELRGGSQRLADVTGAEGGLVVPPTKPDALLSLSRFATLAACQMLRVRMWAR